MRDDPSVRTIASLLFMVLVGFLAVAIAVAPGHAVAQSLIRDAEVERTIRSYANPLLRAAGLSEDGVTIRLIADPTLNAFVTARNRMFLFSGLVIRTETPGQLSGVIAHEIGHIAGGHIARLGEELERAAITSLAALALGAAAGIATGRGDAAAAAMSLGAHAAERNFFAFSRAQESAADQFALRILRQTGQSAAGKLAFFDILGDQELLTPTNQDPYARTHPLTRERILAVRHHVDKEPPSLSTAPTHDQAIHDRMVAKLFAFLEPQARTLQRYREGDDSVAARYARTIAFFRRGDLAQARPLIDGLLADYPDDPFFHELKGQMLVENGRLTEAVESYEAAHRLAPDEPLIAVNLGHALVHEGHPDSLARAEPLLREALRVEPRNAYGWRLLGIAYGRQGREGHAAHALAEHALLTSEPAQALHHIGKAQRLIPQSDPLWLKLADLEQEAIRARDKAEPRRRLAPD